MKNEINAKWFCGANAFHDGTCQETRISARGICERCSALHRKWPTPEQFREEYGEDWPDDAAVYFVGKDWSEWCVDDFAYVKGSESKLSKHIVYVVCACSPYGPPPPTWRPERRSKTC